jgi:hypothetical protein
MWSEIVHFHFLGAKSKLPNSFCPISTVGYSKMRNTPMNIRGCLRELPKFPLPGNRPRSWVLLITLHVQVAKFGVVTLTTRHLQETS